MIFTQTWQGACVPDANPDTFLQTASPDDFFSATVPGNIQDDYARAHDFGDVNYSDNCTRYEQLEDYGWLYRTELVYDKKADERVFFVTKGIEYEYDVRLNGKVILHHEGMYSSVEADITDELTNGNMLEVYIYPHPKREGAGADRSQADQSCKAAVEYGWDWHPRLLISGLWNDTYIETRDDMSLISCDVSYTLNENLTCADVHFDVTGACMLMPVYELYDPDGALVYKGEHADVRLENIRLWWCSGQGEQNLYKWRVTNGTHEKSGFIGFRSIRLVMNEGTWEEPSRFPKSRSVPPITIELNGRRIFAKGSNWVNPELFTGKLNEEIYAKHLTLVKDANMNMLRVWGGAVINKDCFYELCDKLGILIWQEFPLACNNYVGNDAYLTVLEQEASAIIKRLRNHPCLTLWCGGNELFNNWSKMTDQSYALRLLNKLCYELDKKTPFIMTAPLMGMAHGHYIFYDPKTHETVFDIFNHATNTAYSEFGVTAFAQRHILERIIPAEIMDSPMPNSPWHVHNVFSEWDYTGMDAWVYFRLVDMMFGKQDSLDGYIEKSIWTQCEGLKYIFEEARRQKPLCAMALNWCFNEPWNNGVGNAVVAYPCEPKPSYYAVKDALRNVMPSARIPHFEHTAGELFTAELWLLNDSAEDVSDMVKAYLEVNGERYPLLEWATGTVCANTNKRGHVVQMVLPEVESQQAFCLVLEANCGTSRYKLLINPKEKKVVSANSMNV